MKKLFIVANWKSHKTEQDAKNWCNEVAKAISGMQHARIIICAPFTLLSPLKKYISENNLPFFLSAQNISSFPEGAHTGEINGMQIKEFAEYVLLGHSEQREVLHETDDDVFEKVERAKEAGLLVIFCVQSAEIAVPKHVEIVAFEPIHAIGTGDPESPDSADATAKKIKEGNVQYVLYGGSVSGDNVSSFTSMPFLDGVLVGSASLDAKEFIKIITHA